MLPFYQRRVNDDMACEYFSMQTHGIPVKVNKVQVNKDINLIDVFCRESLVLDLQRPII